MNRSWKVATIRGIPIRVHITHPLLLLYITIQITRNFGVYYTDLMQTVHVAPTPPVLPAAFWAIAIAFGFVCSIVLHELSHSLVAQANGVRVQSITLMGLGGFSHMDVLALPPGREAWMAIAGPLSSFVIGGSLYALSYYLPIRPNDLRAAGLLLGQINIGLGIFNLVPAFPMDGGRLLRAALTRWLGRLNATKAAAVVGMLMAALFCVAAFFIPQYLLILIAFFVVFGAWTETAMVERTMLMGRRVGGLANPRIGQVMPETPLEEVVERFRSDNLAAVRVGDGVTGPGAGYITRADLKRVGRRVGSRHAGEIARRDILRVWESADAAAMAFVMKKRGKEAIVVDQDSGEPVGLVTRADLSRMASRAGRPGDAID